jgi:3D (Asp-Asp-Asp) domain-containing protein
MTLWMCALALVITSAIYTKERGSLPALAQVHATQNDQTQSTEVETTPVSFPFNNSIEANINEEAIASAIENDANSADVIETTQVSNESQEILDTTTRWFDGKAIRPSRVIYMTVTGYSPDARSCGIYADNKTAIMYSVWTNGMDLVAADPKVLPYWSLISIPGYADNDIVPVLDCGGAIKGNRLDLLYPTHKLALQWGVRQLPVTVWEYVEEE